MRYCVVQHRSTPTPRNVSVFDEPYARQLVCLARNGDAKIVATYESRQEAEAEADKIRDAAQAPPPPDT